MKVIALNGSPRKNWNTATLLRRALEGAISQGAETELIHLYDLNYKGCISCLACKTRNGPSYGKCAVNDELAPVLRKVAAADAFILGSPIYVGTVTGVMRSFLERLIYPYLVYDSDHSSLFTRKIKTGFIYTMGADENGIKVFGYEQQFKVTGMLMARIFGAVEELLVTDTVLIEDYDKFYAPGFDRQAKAKRREEVFPNDCQKAFEMGARFSHS